MRFTSSVESNNTSTSLLVENEQLKEAITKLKTSLESVEKEHENLKLKMIVQQEITSLEEKKKNAFLEENKALREKIIALEKCNQDLKKKASDEKKKRRLSLGERTGISSVTSDDSSLDSDQKAIRQHAQKMLLWANKTVDRKGYVSSENSFCSGSNRSLEKSNNNLRNLIPRSPSNSSNRIPPDHIRKTKTSPSSSGKSKNKASSGSSLDVIAAKTTKCKCGDKIFPSKSGDADFFLPKVVVCKCGKETNPFGDLSGSHQSSIDGSLSLDFILRPWQAEFLACLSITSSDQLNLAMKERSQAIGRTLKLWYKKTKKKSIPTRSCLVALYIWNRTVQQTHKKLKEQQNIIGNIEHVTRPNILDLKFSVEDRSSEASVSTIGNSSIIRSFDFSSSMDMENEI